MVPDNRDAIHSLCVIEHVETRGRIQKLLSPHQPHVDRAVVRLDTGARLDSTPVRTSEDGRLPASECHPDGFPGLSVPGSLRFLGGRKLRPVERLAGRSHIQIDNIDLSGLAAFGQGLHVVGARLPSQELAAVRRESEGVGLPPRRIAMVERAECEEAVLHRPQP